MPWLLPPICREPGSLVSFCHCWLVVFSARQETAPLLSKAAQVAKRLDWVRKVKWSYR